MQVDMEQSSSAPSWPRFPICSFQLQRSSFYSQSQRQAMTTCGVALHRSIGLWLQHAGQSFCSMYDGIDTTETVLFCAYRSTQKRRLYELIFCIPPPLHSRQSFHICCALFTFAGLAFYAHTGRGHHFVL